MMKVAKELPNYSTLSNLGRTALYLIATLPEEEREEQIQRIEDGDNPTVRELKEVKKKLNLRKLANKRLQAENERIKSAKVEVKETIKEVIPDDYRATQDLNKQLLEKNKKLSKSVKAMEEREEVDKKSAQYDELTRAIEESQGQLNSVQKQISAYKNITSLLQKGNDFLASMGVLIYADEEKVLKADGIIRNEFDSFSSRGIRFFNDLNDIHFYICKRQILVVFYFFKIYQVMISCERFLNFLLTGGALFRIMDTSLEDYSRGLRGRVGNAVGV